MTPQNQRPVPLSKDAKNRLKWIKHYEKFKNARLTCRHFGISPSTFYHWQKKYLPDNLARLEDTAPRKPKNLRKPRWDQHTLLLIHRFLEANPTSHKKDIRLFLAKHGVQVSASTTARIMQQLESHKKRFSW